MLLSTANSVYQKRLLSAATRCMIERVLNKGFTELKQIKLPIGSSNLELV